MYKAKLTPDPIHRGLTHSQVAKWLINTITSAISLDFQYL